jgi:hypothetical protein
MWIEFEPMSMAATRTGRTGSSPGFTSRGRRAAEEWEATLTAEIRSWDRDNGVSEGSQAASAVLDLQ